MMQYNFTRRTGESTDDFRQRVLDEIGEELEPGRVIRPDIAETISGEIDDACREFTALVHEQGPPSVEVAVRHGSRVH